MDYDLAHMWRYPAGYTDRDFMRAAQERDWTRIRTSGSHAVFTREGWPQPLSIPVGLKKNGTKRAIIQQLQEAEHATTD